MVAEYHFMRIRDVIEKTGLSRSTIYLRMQQGKFPVSVKLSERCVAWRSTDIQSWMENPMGWTELKENYQ